MKYTIGFATRHFATDVTSVLVDVIRSISSAPEIYVDIAKPQRKYDLIVFTGGADIDPAFYGEENYSSYTNPERDSLEKDLFRHADEEQKFLGICRGHQLLNALYGGKLIQDIPQNHPGWHPLSNGWHVNSLHHQGVISVGAGVEILAVYKNGSNGKETEVAEITRGKYFLSFQFHPEFALPDPKVEFINLLGKFMLEERWEEQSG